MNRTDLSPRSAKSLAALGAAFGLGLLVTICYLGAPENAFHFDDLPNIVHHAPVHVESLTWSELTRSAMDGYLRSRILPNLTFGIDWWRGEGDFGPFAVTNVAIHWVASIAVFWLLYSILAGARGVRGPHVFAAALLAAAIWASHPIQVQSVAYLVQRMTSLATLFVVVSVVSFVRFRQGARWWWLAAAVTSFGLGVLSKEIAWVTPVLWLLVERYLSSSRGDRGWSRVELLCWSVFALVGGYLLLDLAVLEGAFYDFVQGTYARRDFSLVERLLTEPRVVLIYAGLLLWPNPARFSIEHDVAVSETLWLPWTSAASVIVIAIWIGAGIALLLSRKRSTIGLWMLWIPVTLALESSVIGVELMFEHRMYLPSVGAAGLLSCGVAALWSRASCRSRWLVPIGLLVAVALLVSSTRSLVPVWRSSISLYEHAARNAPESARIWSNLGGLYAEAGRLAEAEEALDRAVSLDPEMADATFNRGTFRLEVLGRPQEAIADFDAAIEKKPGKIQAYINRGNAHFALGRLDLAEQDYSFVIDLGEANGFQHRDTRVVEQFATALNNRGLCRRQEGDLSGALEDHSVAVKISPESPESWLFRGTAQMVLGELDGAKSDFQRAIDLAPEDGRAHFRLGEVHRLEGRRDATLESFRTACGLGNEAACEAMGETSTAEDQAESE